MQHVLVIENESLLAKCYSDMALFAGASSVDVVMSEEAAVDAAQRHRPTIIVSDVDLAEGGTGPDAVTRIWALCGDIPVIFVTGNPDDRAANTLASAILAKPCSVEKFAKTFAAIASPHWDSRRARPKHGSKNGPAPPAAHAPQPPSIS